MELSGVCRCHHVDLQHFDEVGACSRCVCDHFVDVNYVPCGELSPDKGDDWARYRCTLPAGHEGDHAARRLDGTLRKGWAA